MAQKRERLQVIHDILHAIRDGRTRPTHILYRANLSHQMLEEYMAELLDKELVIETAVPPTRRHKESNPSKSYALAPKGFEFLQKYGEMIEFMESFGLR